MTVDLFLFLQMSVNYFIIFEKQWIYGLITAMIVIIKTEFVFVKHISDVNVFFNLLYLQLSQTITTVMNWSNQ